ncbi:hypothetical protein [Paenibacillus radicis (ex Xue et al. 2023)]
MANRFLAKVDWYILRRLRLFWNNKHWKRKRNWSEMHILLQRALPISVTRLPIDVGSRVLVAYYVDVLR